MRQVLIGILAIAFLLLPRAGDAEIARGIDRTTAEAEESLERIEAKLEDGSPEDIRRLVADLRNRIDEGKEASEKLWADIEKLEAEKRQLQTVQTALTSGLIGALVTVFVAMLGLLSNFKKNLVDRDYRRLELIEKAAKLRESGLSLPDDLTKRYLGG